MTLYQETYDHLYMTGIIGPGRSKLPSGGCGRMDHAGRCGFPEIGIGALLGLNDWRYEMAARRPDADYLMKHYWQSHITVSFPRLRKAYGGIEHHHRYRTGTWFR